MKKSFIVLPMLAFLVGCAPEAQPVLPPTPPSSYTVVLDATSSTLTSDDSTAPITVNLTAQENSEVTYSLEIGKPCYLKQAKEGLDEIVIKKDAYIKSKSTYKVNRLILDIFEGSGDKYEVHNKADGSGDALVKHASEITPVYPEDSGAVYEYDLASSTEWSITNTFSNKGGFIYSVKIVFTVE